MIKHFKIVIYLTFLMCFLPLSAQNIDPDVLKKRAYALIAQDEFYATFDLLDSVLEISKNKKLKKLEAEVYNSYGVAYVRLSDFKNAEIYHKRSLRINDSLKSKHKICVDFYNLTRAYYLEGNFKKFDSLLPISKAISLKYKEPSLFFNYKIEMESLYERKMYKEAIFISELALEQLSSPEFEVFFKNDKKERIEYSTNFEMCLAFSMMESKTNPHKAYDLLNDLLSRDLEKILWHDHMLYRNLSRIHHYKTRYFREVLQLIRFKDSAASNFIKSREYNLIAMNMLETRSKLNSSIIVDKINADKEIEQIKILNKKETLKRSNANTISILAIFIGVLSLAIVYYVNRSGKYGKAINNFLLEQQKKQMLLDKERLQFFSVVSHQLRTPIYSLNKLTKLIKTEKDPELTSKHLSTIESSSNQLSSIIENVIQFTRFNMGNFYLRAYTLNIVKTVNNICNSLNSKANYNQVIIHKDFDNVVSRIVLIDKKVITLILYNLINNAIKFNRKGNIWVSIRELPSSKANLVRLKFTVRDDGIGMSQEQQEAIFDNSKSILNENDPNKGIGLGLRLLKKMLSLYNSSIVLKSEPNKGASFTFLLDLKKGKDEHIEKSLKFYKKYLSNKKVLNVDDNKINLLVTKKMLQNFGILCDVVDNGFEAINMVKEKQYDIILMDINMPNIDGIETTRRIRKFNTKIPIIAFSAVDLNAVREEAFASKINDIIAKPFINENFYQKLFTHINKADNNVKVI